MPLDGTPLPRALAPATPPGRRPHRAPFWRGAWGAISLAAWSIAGVLGAALALLPVALERGPRGRLGGALPEGSVRRLGVPVPDVDAIADERASEEPAPAARAAGEAFPR